LGHGHLRDRQCLLDDLSHLLLDGLHDRLPGRLEAGIGVVDRVLEGVVFRLVEQFSWKPTQRHAASTRKERV
jgi:hypothetical protein